MSVGVADPVSIARSLTPLVREEAASAEQAGTLPPSLIDAFRGSGLFALQIPRSLGGFEADGLRAIAAVGDRVVVGGFYRGTISIGRETLKSSGGDDAYFAAFDGNTRYPEDYPQPGAEIEATVILQNGNNIRLSQRPAGGAA